MIRPSEESRAPRPSRRRGRRLRLKIDEDVLREGLLSGPWLETVTALLGEEAMADGQVAARDGAVRSLNFSSGRISGPVEADGEAPRNMAFTMPTIHDAGWDAIVADMAGEALYTARLLEGELPPGLSVLFQATWSGAWCRPKEDGLAVDADQRVVKQHWRPAALAWLVAERSACQTVGDACCAGAFGGGAAGASSPPSGHCAMPKALKPTQWRNSMQR